MGQWKRRRFTEEFKLGGGAALPAARPEHRQVARELDLTESALRWWVTQYAIDHGSNPTGALTTEEKAELRTLRREVRVLREERDILKKRITSLT